MTGFRTRKGVVLLYEPDLLDAWIGRRIEKLEGGSFADMESGKTLNKQEGKSYKAYLKRHKSRNEEARLADKLFHIKYLPLQADETRAYIARFPAQVKNLLPKARKIRNKLRREGGPASTVPPKSSEGGQGGQIATYRWRLRHNTAAGSGNNPK